MSTPLEFYLARAAECANDAEKATLENVRLRCRRSEAAWQAMADRARKSEAVRRQAAEAARLRQAH